jgi:hypothetical protein
MKVDPASQAENSILQSREGSREVTALGAITAVLVAFASLVHEGSLPLVDYLVFAAFLLVGAGALVWRLVKLGPAHKAK